MIFGPQHVDQLIDRAWRVDLSVCLGVLAEHRRRFPVKDELDIRKSAHTGCAYLVRAVHRHRARTCEADLLILLGDNLEIAVVVE